MLVVLLFIVVIAILFVIVKKLLSIYGIDIISEIKKIMIEAKKETFVDADDEFNEMYNTLRNQYKEKESNIRSLTAFISRTEIILAAIAIILVFISIVNQYFLFLVFSDLLIAAFLLYIKETNVAKLRKELKSELLPKFVKDINEGFMFDENGKMSERSYRVSGFDVTFNTFNSSNYLEGYLDEGTKISLANVDIGIKDAKGIKNIFEGTFGYINIGKRFSEPIKILNKQEKRELTNEADEDLKSKKFSDLFDVYADDVMFREVFNKQLIKAIMGYIKNFDTKLEIIIHGSSLYFRFYNKDLIEYKNFGSNDEKLCLWKYYCMIQLIYIIVDSINNM